VTKLGNELMRRIGKSDRETNPRLSASESELEYQNVFSFVTEIEKLGKCMPKKKWIRVLRIALRRAEGK
jgi:hypothetical protein